MPEASRLHLQSRWRAEDCDIRGVATSMSEVDASSAHATGGREAPAANFARRQLPFLAILALAIGGVAYTNVSRQPLVGYWEFLAMTTGLACVLAKWGECEDREARIRLMWTQALHWGAVLVAMNIMLFAGVQQLLPAPASSLVLLMLLALSTFLAGLNLFSLQLCFLGGALALAVPAISWVKQSALFLVLAAVALTGLVLAFWPRGRETGSTSEHHNRSSHVAASDDGEGTEKVDGIEK